MLEYVLTALLVIVVLTGLIAILLVTHAVWKGAAYIGASNFGFAKDNVCQITPGRLFARWSFLATPSALIIVGAWAGYSIVDDLLFWLGDAGFFDREYGDWRTYKSVASSTIGGLLGLFFIWWLLRLCGPVFEALCQVTAPIDELKKII